MEKKGDKILAERRILPFGDPILRKISKPVTGIDPKTLKLLGDLVNTLYATDGRAGLAAPQIGSLKRIVVMDCGEGLIELINPEMIEMQGEQIGPEACLSLPDYTGFVKRAKYVKVKALNRRGQSYFLEGEDFLARCIQHEMDHLDGILFIDHIQEDALVHDQTKLKVNVWDVPGFIATGIGNPLSLKK